MMPTSTNLEQVLQDALDRLDGAESNLVLNFTGVERVETGTVRALEALAGRAEEKKIRVVLDAVNVEVYRVLKLVKLAPRFSFGA